MSDNLDGTTRGDTPLGCAETRDLLPLRESGALDGRRSRLVETHLAGCEECADEARFVQRVHDARPRPPADLADRITARLNEERARPRAAPVVHAAPRRGRRLAARWGLAAAASLVVAIAAGLLWYDDGTPNREALLASLVDGDQEAAAAEWMVAGAPVWDALPDEVLMTLLEEDGS